MEIEESKWIRTRGVLEGMGIPVTASLLEFAAGGVDTYVERRERDAQIGDEQLAREIAENHTRHLGNRNAILIVADNDRLRAWRKPVGEERPTCPSVEDLALEVLHQILQNVITAYAEKYADA